MAEPTSKEAKTANRFGVIVGVATFGLIEGGICLALYLISGGGNDMGALATIVLGLVASPFCLIAGIVATWFCNPEING